MHGCLQIAGWDRSLLPEADAEFVVLADTHYMIDPGEDSVEFASRRLQADRADRAWQLASSLGCPNVFHMGDLVQEFPGTEGFGDAMSGAIEQFSNHDLVPRFVAGNHDVGDKPDPTMPTRPVTTESLAEFHDLLGPSWYAVDVGPLRVVVLNSQIMNTTLTEAGLQRDWVERELATHSGRRQVVMLHLPPYLDEPAEPGLGHYDNIAEPDRGWLIELLERHEVELLLAAHVHCSFFDRIGSTRFRILNSTSFTRPGFCHMFTSAPPPDQGRDDAAKLGFLLARVREEQVDLHWLRSEGFTVAESPGGPGWQTLVTGLSSTMPGSALGLSLAHPVSTRTEIPRAWPSALRQRVRNDYPLLASLELGTRAVRLPACDLDDPFLSSRIGMLREEGVDVVATMLWDQSAHQAEWIDRHGDQVDTWEWQLAGTDHPTAHQIEMLQRFQAAGVSQSLSAVVPGETIAGKQHPRTRTGFRFDGLMELDSQLSGAGVTLDRVAGRFDWGSIDIPPNPGPLAGLEAIRHVDWQLELGEGSDVHQAARAVMSLLAVAGMTGASLFIGPLVGMDRTMDLCPGLLDPLCNPRPVFDALCCLNSVLSAAGQTAEGAASELKWSESDEATVGEMAMMAVVIPREPLDGGTISELVSSWISRFESFRVYDLCERMVVSSNRGDLSGCLGRGWSRPVLLVG